MLKHQIPIRTFAQWDEKRPGFVEIDLVGHDGGDPSGDFAQTLNVTDIATGWTEAQAVKNKAQRWVFEAITDMRVRFPLTFWALILTTVPNSSTIISTDIAKKKR